MRSTFNVQDRIILDYAGAATPVLLGNLSGIASIGDALWTVSDEGRTVECLVKSGGGYRLKDQFSLDSIISDLPGASTVDELDLESIDIADGQLWLCGSHCRVRKQLDSTTRLSPTLRKRPSRCLLASIKLKDNGLRLGKHKALPFEGIGSLRRHLKSNPYLAPFVGLPSKENGVDVEGFAVHNGKALLGFRGPLIDSIAVVVSLEIDEDFENLDSELSFLDLGGLGIRDLIRFEDDLLILAGPVSAADGPFRLYRWVPLATKEIQQPKHLFTWPESSEKPEGLCLVERAGQVGVLVIYDRPDIGGRIQGSLYEADWLIPN